jgi:hypothetical protein
MMKNEMTVETKAAKMPFPSQVNSPAPNADVVAIARELVDTARDTNNVLQAAGNVHYFVRSHYVDVASGTYGIESLIAAILAANGSIFPAGIEETEFRKVAIAGAMFTTEIIAKVRETFGSERYPDSTILSFLAHFMLKNKRVGKLKLKGAEDQGRTSAKPRVKYYLIEQSSE